MSYPKLFYILNSTFIKNTRELQNLYGNQKYENKNYGLSMKLTCRWICTKEEKKNLRINMKIDKFFINVPIYVTARMLSSTYGLLNVYYQKMTLSTAIKKNLEKLFEIEPYKYTNVRSAYTNFLFVSAREYLIADYDTLATFFSLKDYMFDCFITNSHATDFLIQTGFSAAKIFSFQKLLTEQKNLRFYSVKIENGSTHQKVCKFSLVLEEKFIEEYAESTRKFNRERKKLLDKIKDEKEVFQNMIEPSGVLYPLLNQIKISQENIVSSVTSKINSICIKSGDRMYDNVASEEQFVNETMKSVDFKVVTFDIEVGWIDPSVEKEKMPTVFDGYVQCICFVDATFNKKSGYFKECYKILAFCPSSLNFDKMKSQFDNAIKSENVKIIMFSKEEDMIKSFFYYLNTSCDYLISFNGKKFDWPFLIMRYNHLVSNIFSNTYFNSMNLSNDFFLRNVTESPASIKYLCPCSNKETSFRSNAQTKCEFFFCDSCGKMIGIKECLNNPSRLLIKTPASYFKSVENQLLFHRDLCGDERLVVKSLKRSLEVMCNYHFRKQVEQVHVGKEDDECVVIHVKIKEKQNKTNLVKTMRVFQENIKIFCYMLDPNSLEFQKSFTGNLVNFLIVHDSSGSLDNVVYRTSVKYNEKNVYDKDYDYVKLDLEPEKFDDLDDNFLFSIILDVKIKKGDINVDNVLSQASKYYISVGKTSELTIKESMNWCSEEVAIKTCEYCLFDIKLTFELEKKIVTVLQYCDFSKDSRPIFEILSNTTSAIGRHFYLCDLYKNNHILFKIQNINQKKFLQISMYNECKSLEQLESEGVCLDDETGNNKKTGDYLLNYPIIKLRGKESAEDFFSNNFYGINEHELKVFGEYDASDESKLKENIKFLTS